MSGKKTNIVIVRFIKNQSLVFQKYELLLKHL